MNEHEFEYDEDEWSVVTPSRKLQRADLAVLGLHLVNGVVSAVSATAALALQCVVGHANHNIERQEMHEQAAREIERLTEE